MSDHNLYFVAIVPGEPVLSEVRAFKEEISEKFASSHALRSPAHITLFPPFKATIQELEELEIFLDSVARETTSFVLGLNGFAAFPPRVIFVQPESSSELELLYERLSYPLHRMVESRFRPDRTFHPHMTIAFRDLSRDMFKPAWSDFKERSFKRRFAVRQFELLKHTGTLWRRHRTYAFGDFRTAE